MINSILSFIFTLVESILLFLLIGYVMPGRFSDHRKPASIIAAVLIYAILIYYLPDFPVIIKFILYLIIALILTQFIYKGKIYIRLFYVLVANFVFLISDILTGNFVSFLTSMDIQSMLNISGDAFKLSLLAKSINIILFVLCMYYFKKLTFEITKRYWLLMDILILLLAIILQFVMEISPVLQKEFTYYSIYIFGISVGFLVIGGMIIFFFGEICSYQEKEKENYILNMRNHLLEQQLSYHESATMNLKKIRHDINRNLTNISYLLKENNINESVAYIDEITKALEGTKAIVNCGNDIIDVILNYKIAVCKQHNIDIRIDIDHVPHLSINPMDLTAILANILDNAIEALDMMDIGKRFISGKIFCYKNYLSIVIKNPYEQPPIIENNTIKTQKTDKKIHGYGLMSVRASTEKYGGSFKVDLKNNVFSAIVMLPIEIMPQQ